MDKPQRIFFYLFFLGGWGKKNLVISPPLSSMSEDESDRENLTELWGSLTGLIQGCITFSVAPLESQNNFVFSLLNRHESGLLYTKSGRNLSLLTQSQSKVYVSYIMSQDLKSGARVPSISVIKMLGFFAFLFLTLWVMFWGLHPKPKGIENYWRWGVGWSQAWNFNENIEYLKVCDKALGVGSAVRVQVSELPSHFRVALQVCWWKPNWTQCHCYMSGSTAWPQHWFSSWTRLSGLGLGEELPSDDFESGYWRALNSSIHCRDAVRVWTSKNMENKWRE